MKAPWYESKGLIPWMILLVIILGVSVAFKENWLGFVDFTKHKDKIDGITKILASSIILFGVIVSYFRFFKGRTFSQKLNIIPAIGIIPNETDNFHWIDIELENRGSVSIWNYKVTIYATLHKNEPYCRRVTEFMPGVEYKST